MFPIIFFIFIMYIIIKKGSSLQNSNIYSNLSIYPRLHMALKNQQFTNIKTLSTTSSMTTVTADSHGENFLFAFKTNNIPYNVNELSTLYEKSQKLHIHNVVIIKSFNTTFPSMTLQKITDYNFEIWDMNKLNSLATNITNPTQPNHTYTKSVLRTSDTSNDTCKIDTDSYNPIQEDTDKKGSLFGNLFKKPDRL